ncbi:hypothetical protein L218DRAFT_992928 [Marasmius fiardii PR-910]|nr:hypothetical protein L218DRAFT_992928 [Marasmius fiardii PR-910]
MTNIVIAVNAMGAGIDVLIAAAMVYLLGRRHTKIVRTNRMLRQIVRSAPVVSLANHSEIFAGHLLRHHRCIDKPQLGSLCTLMVLVTAVALPGTQYVLLFYLMLTRMYSNSLLATLNARDSIRVKAASSGTVVNSSGLSHPRYPTHPAMLNSGEAYRLDDLKRTIEDLDETRHEDIAIKVDRRTEVGSF